MRLIPEKETSYELLDSGEGMKLERFGTYILARPDPESLWKKKLPESEWKKAHATYVRKGKVGEWKKSKDLPSKWEISYGGLSFELRPTSFKHTGLFPEQKANWQWLREQASSRKGVKALNLFAYTGGATLALSEAGAEVIHVDSSKVSIQWARKNAELSGLSDNPIRWIEDDVIAFLKREVKRGNTYDIIVMDPPVFGHGSRGAVWKIEERFYELFSLVKQVLSDKPLGVLINGYTAGYSPIVFENNLSELVDIFGGSVESGELALLEKGNRVLPAGIVARWKA